MINPTSLLARCGKEMLDAVIQVSELYRRWEVSTPRNNEENRFRTYEIRSPRKMTLALSVPGVSGK